jgi:hypothetical protein
MAFCNLLNYLQEQCVDIYDYDYEFAALKLPMQM